MGEDDTKIRALEKAIELFKLVDNERLVTLGRLELARALIEDDHVDLAQAIKEEIDAFAKVGKTEKTTAKKKQ